MEPADVVLMHLEFLGAKLRKIGTEVQALGPALHELVEQIEALPVPLAYKTALLRNLNDLMTRLLAIFKEV